MVIYYAAMKMNGKFKGVLGSRSLDVLRDKIRVYRLKDYVLDGRVFMVGKTKWSRTSVRY